MLRMWQRNAAINFPEAIQRSMMVSAMAAITSCQWLASIHWNAAKMA
jgi:hypothetical protein